MGISEELPSAVETVNHNNREIQITLNNRGVTNPQQCKTKYKATGLVFCKLSKTKLDDFRAAIKDLGVFSTYDVTMESKWMANLTIHLAHPGVCEKNISSCDSSCPSNSILANLHHAQTLMLFSSVLINNTVLKEPMIIIKEFKNKVQIYFVHMPESLKKISMTLKILYDLNLISSVIVNTVLKEVQDDPSSKTTLVDRCLIHFIMNGIEKTDIEKLPEDLALSDAIGLAQKMHAM